MIKNVIVIEFFKEAEEKLSFTKYTLEMHKKKERKKKRKKNPKNVKFDYLTIALTPK